MRRRQLLDLVEHRGIVHVDARDGVVGLGVSRLFLDADDLSAGYLGHAEPLRVGDLLEQDVGPELLRAEPVGGLADAAFDDVVAQYHADLVAVGEMFGQIQGVGDSAFALLVGVVDVLEPELLPVGQQPQEIA